MSQFFQIHPENPQARLIKQAVEIICKGGVVIYPTDSSYAIGCQIGDKTAIERLMSANLSLPKTVWGRLNLGWVFFFFAMGAANLYVAYHFSTDLWVNFKLFGSTALMFVFIVAQSLVLAKYGEEGKQ